MGWQGENIAEGMKGEKKLGGRREEWKEREQKVLLLCKDNNIVGIESDNSENLLHSLCNFFFFFFSIVNNYVFQCNNSHIIMNERYYVNYSSTNLENTMKNLNILYKNVLVLYYVNMY